MFYKSSRFKTSIWKMYSAVRFTENSLQSHELLRYISLKNVNFGDFILYSAEATENSRN